MYHLRLFFLLLLNINFINAYERITSFVSNIKVNTDATLVVEESIEVISEHQTIRHGIVREFPTNYRNYGSHHIVDFKIISVTHNGNPTHFKVASVSNGKKIYIGNENSFVSRGKNLYTITYETNRQIGFFDNYDEIYWNVTGTGWRLPIEKVEARIQLPKGISQQLINAEAYTGFQGKKGKNYSYAIKNNYITFSTNHSLKQFEGITIVATFPKGFVQEPSLYQQIYWIFRDNFFLILILLLLIILFISGIITAKRRNRPGTIIPLFYPPKNMTPSDVGFMNNMQFNNILLSADIIDLAVRGFITITYMPDVDEIYTLSIKDSIDSLKVQKKIHQYDEKLLSALFETKSSISISNKNSKIIEKSLKECKEHTNSYHDLDISVLKYFLYALGFLTILLFCYIIFSLNELSGIIFIVFYSITTLLFSHISSIKKLFSFYTPAGRIKQDAIDGFKLYLTTAERERMNIIGTPPTKTPELYEKYLPYAIALGVEKRWTAQFSTLFKQFGVEKGYPYHPSWYTGRSFKSYSFGSTMINSFTSSIATASTPPGRSSGSRGKGSSGGGGGGGGGGGW